MLREYMKNMKILSFILCNKKTLKKCVFDGPYMRATQLLRL